MIIKKERLLTIIFIIIPYVLFCAYMVGIKDPLVWRDYGVYLNYFDDSANDIIYIITNIQDPVFVLLMHPFHSLAEGFDIFLFWCAIITLSLKIYSISLATQRFSFFLVLYSSYLLCLHDYIQIRIALALAIFCYAMYVRKGWVQFLLFVVSIFVHLSLVVPLCIFCLVHAKRIGYKRIFWSGPAIIALSLLIQQGAVFISRVNQYLELQKQGIGVDINVYSVLPFFQLLTVLFVFFNKKLISYKYTFEFVMSYVGVIIFYSTLAIPAVALRYFEISNLFFIILLSRLFFKSYFFIAIFFMYIIVGIKNYGQLLNLNIPFLTS
ncbi:MULTISPECIES: EpsG family protein [Klebsiella]|nr:MULTISPECIES: EpsG family protein [Klebsiella]ARI09499.1 hypothetical protein BWI76_19045 [Klebsiella sp. M5al]EKP25139.1 capsular polysaccharide biosynthesis protein [Klebsiella michiganensis]KZT46675.1 hypothetical protein A6A30_12540 [Klebsiella michiganensis]MBZ0041704.1 EpsG family protein [Klebsiella grimontii]